MGIMFLRENKFTTVKSDPIAGNRSDVPQTDMTFQYVIIDNRLPDQKVPMPDPWYGGFPDHVLADYMKGFDVSISIDGVALTMTGKDLIYLHNKLGVLLGKLQRNL